MSDTANTHQPPRTSFDEENLLHEINEDNRLRRLGIEPDDMDSLAILIALKKKVADIKREKLERKQQKYAGRIQNPANPA